MIIELSLNEETDHFVGFSEAVLFFDPPEELPDSLSIPAWGLDVNREVFRWLGFDFGGDVYVAGKSMVHLEGINGGTLNLGLYDPKNPTEFLRDERGEVESVRFHWGPVIDRRSALSPDPDLFRFWMGSVLDQPHGYVELHFDIVRARVEIPLKHCVHLHDYIFHTHLYGWDPIREKRFTGMRTERVPGRGIAETSWKNGMPDGMCKLWSVTGQRISETEWRRGRLHGQWTKWWSNGQVRFQSHMNGALRRSAWSGTS